ncbi:alpha/beta hydrolase [Sphingomonas tagetis]|nr:alpha/beta hydrolase [Sphingomonas tagetis]
MGARFDPAVLAQTRELFAIGAKQAPWAGIQPIRDLRYGPAARHVLDFFRTSRADAPLLLFVHGGGFVAGDKDGDGVFYGNVGRYFAHHGYAAVCMNYRLAPEAPWPSGSEDVATALAWLATHGSEYGGDPQRIVLLAQSAGAAHAAGAIFDQRFGAPAGLRAAALLSGFYEMTADVVGTPAAYFGEDPGVWTDRSPLNHIAPGHVELLLTLAELDPAEVAHQTLRLAMELNAVDGRPPQLAWLEGHNHVSPVLGIGLGDDRPGKIVRSFFDAIVGASSWVAQ